jgi:hypothetical protein
LFYLGFCLGGSLLSCHNCGWGLRFLFRHRRE